MTNISKETLYVCTEEGASDGLKSAVQVVSDRLDLGITVGSASYFKNISGRKIAFELVPSTYGSEFEKIICVVVQAKKGGSFVDALFYRGTELPSPANTPIAAVEITKNGLKDSGNMTDQRASKFAPLIFKTPSLPCFYLIHSEKKISLSEARARPPHRRAFDRLLIAGVTPVFTSDLSQKPVYYA